MPKLSIKDLDLRGKRVFMRVDFNVPLKEGRIGDDTRLRASLPTILFALDAGATVVLASHLGRPKGKVNPQFSLKPVADRAAELLARPVTFTDDCVGDQVKQAIDRTHASGGGVLLLENLRFHAEEEKNDPRFAASLASLADVYVDDAFGAAHRAHASVEGITHHLHPAAAGLLMEQELRYLGHVLESPERPFVAILGGAKVSDKIEVIENLLGKVDRLLIGGAMAYTFFKSRGLPIGRSLVEDDKIEAARSIIDHAAARRVPLELPLDHVVADRVEANAPHEVLAVTDPKIGDRYGVDIGPATAKAYAELLASARSVVWNGPMGVFEIDAFAAGTNAVARAVASVNGTTIIGGGDSIAAIRKAGMADRVTHISTGGGASLEFLGGRTLPGVAALTDKQP
ncbi:MAG TPA: phosphoglycerate kinase [Vicinamibacterales bacterium]|nr:phosphoglycerate kinase [Vicinamibacterales bacterium]